MEANLLVRCECRDEAQRALFVEFLDEATRPILAEDVAPEQRATFSALEALEPPEFIARHGKTALRISWFIGEDDNEIRLILKDLMKAGVVDAYAALWLDDHVEDLIAVVGGKLSRLRIGDSTDVGEPDESLFDWLDRQRAHSVPAG